MKQTGYQKNRKILFTAAGVVLALAAAFWIYTRGNPSGSPFLPGASSGEKTSSAAGSAGKPSGPSNPAAGSSAAPASSGPAVSPLDGIFADYGVPAQKKLMSLSLREKVGQVFVFRCPQTGAAKAAADYQPGGYCLMASDFSGKTTAQVQAALKSYQDASKIGMILCTDEEGGTVVRISKYPALRKTAFRSPQQVFRLSGLNGIYDDTVQKAQLLKKLGLNLNLAPVCDVSTNPSDFIYGRTFGKDASKTADFVRVSVSAYNSQNLSCTLKHFPGYGNNRDTHTGIAYDKRDYSVFQKQDFVPFQAGIDAGAQCVMVSHSIVNCMDPSRPSSLSPKVHEILRGELGFTGVIMTDDLSMGAITDFTAGKSPSVAAFTAGNDIVLSSDMARDFNALYAAVQDGTVSEQRLDESVLRILAWKYKMGII
ncbi:glycoside hydrolase family 3 N-terminal domain-containing protein [Clostridium sp. KNHs216]|uniref:glycoside hydrolase family 3 N-terminal domain-containing protein n=1 Tax=Clostridium sp. KNHs216 TaxID=1550235 RepID=UPI00114DAE06|nr:glycoside hydrolase family 3 N-terminal domain-containing protein [Clostridium sp. KNHs216]TQI68681.1 beta-N-acetylhexosaminidase [Clostridium sp. KNHs216]